jgi:hypothetical protein
MSRHFASALFYFDFTLLRGTTVVVQLIEYNDRMDVHIGTPFPGPFHQTPEDCRDASCIISSGNLSDMQK